MTTRTTSTAKADLPEVANLRDAKKAQAQAKQRHPAGKKLPTTAAKPAPAKAAAKPAANRAEKPAEQEKRTYSATARNGKTNTRASATPLVAALDVKIAGRKGAQYAAGVIVGFYTSKEVAEKAADEINGGGVADWSDAVVVPAKLA